MARNLFSVSSIQRLISSIKSSQREKERLCLIEKSKGFSKELDPTYDLEEVIFDDETRIAKIKFQIIKTYRTIERYVTQDYKKYPIYSNWKSKISYANKRIKLSNQVLETLNKNEDFLIRSFADQIILALHREDLIPSWLSQRIIENEYEQLIQEQVKKQNELICKYNEEKQPLQLSIDKINFYLNDLDKSRQSIEKSILKKQNKVSKIMNSKKQNNYIILSILTVGIYAVINSNFRKNAISNKIKKSNEKLDKLKTVIIQNENKIKSFYDSIEERKLSLENEISQTRKNITKYSEQKKSELEKVQSLTSSYPDIIDFVPLKAFAGYENEKIIGCYAIHNKEKDKYYIGQSKDVIRRIKQHFKGTVPNNIIFAEDYYSTNWVNKEDLFEVKIIRLSTKDELDETEKQLIEKYAANIFGYNSTKGNM